MRVKYSHINTSQFSTASANLFSVRFDRFSSTLLPKPLTGVKLYKMLAGRKLLNKTVENMHRIANFIIKVLANIYETVLRHLHKER